MKSPSFRAPSTSEEGLFESLDETLNLIKHRYPTVHVRSFRLNRDFKIYDAVVDENATKQQYHWLKEE